jgi:hypothetical protein
VRLYFDTDPAWIEALQAWGASDPRVGAIWVFGSRARGVRTPKEVLPLVPDLDVGYALTGGDEGECLAYAMFEGGRARERLQALIAAPLDFQYADPATDTRVWPAILDHGVLIYQRNDQGKAGHTQISAP